MSHKGGHSRPMSKKKTRQAELSVTVRLDILLGNALRLNHIKVSHNLFLKKGSGFQKRCLLSCKRHSEKPHHKRQKLTVLLWIGFGFSFEGETLLPRVRPTRQAVLPLDPPSRAAIFCLGPTCLLQ